MQPSQQSALARAPAPRAWAGCALGLALGAALLWWAPREALDWQPARAPGQAWRLWTAAFVHWSPQHLQANLLGCAAVAAFGIAAGTPRPITWAWLVAWPLTHAALVMAPALPHYGGLSGVLHAGVAAAALGLAWQGTGRRRVIGGAVLVGLAAKLMLERPWQGPVQIVAGWDIPLVPLAHVTGAASGLLCGAAALVICDHRRTLAR